MNIKRGEIWWATLPDPYESGPGYRRPVIVIQSNEFNKSKINTVIVIILTSNLRLANAPGNIMLSKRQTKLKKDSVANVSQIYTIDKKVLTEKISTLPLNIVQQLNISINLVLNLS